MNDRRVAAEAANRRAYDDIDDEIWRMLVFDPVHAGMALTNIGGCTVLDRIGVELADADRPVVDLGAGQGAASLYLASRLGFSVTGIDVNDHQVERARANLMKAPNDRVRFARADVVEDIPGGPYSAAIAIDVLMLVGDLDRALRTAARALVPGGSLVVADVMAGENTDAATVAFARDEDGIVNLLDREGYRVRMANAGITLVVWDDMTPLARSVFETIESAVAENAAVVRDVGGEALLEEWRTSSRFYREAFEHRRLTYAYARAVRASLPTATFPGP